MQDSLDLEKIARRVEKHQQRERRVQWLSLAIVLVVVLLLLTDIAFFAPMSQQLEHAITQNPENLAAIMQHQLAAMASLAVELASLFILIGLAHWRTNRSKPRKEFVRKILLHLLPDLEYNPPEASTSSTSWVTWVGIVVVVADITIVLFNQPLVLTFVLPLFVVGAGWLWTASARPSAESEDVQSQQQLMLVQQIMIVAFASTAIAVGLIVLYPWLVDRGVRSLFALVFALLAGIGLAYGLFYAFAIIPYLTIRNGPLAHGDYVAAMALWQEWGRRVPFLGTDPLIGFALLLAGHQEEAKATWWALLLQGFAQGHPLHAALRLINFASALESPDYDAELVGLFEGAVRIAPENPVPYRTLAAYYLSTDAYLERALALTDMMMRYARPPSNNLIMQRYDWSLTLGVRALALASMGHHDQANALTARAFAEGDPQFQPGMAWLHYNAGRIKLTQQDASAATDHFTQAIKLDLQGATGAWAQRALDNQ